MSARVPTLILCVHARNNLTNPYHKVSICTFPGICCQPSTVLLDQACCQPSTVLLDPTHPVPFFPIGGRGPHHMRSALRYNTRGALPRTCWRPRTRVRQTRVGGAPWPLGGCACSAAMVGCRPNTGSHAEACSKIRRGQG